MSARLTSARARSSARANADAAGVVVDVRRGSLDRALARGPTTSWCQSASRAGPQRPLGESIPDEAGPPWAYNAGEDGRGCSIRCATRRRICSRGGTFLVVLSEFSRISKRCDAADARTHGADRCITAVPFSPVLTARTQWLQVTSRMTLGQQRRASW